MTDLWHANVPDEWLDRILAACALRPDLDFCLLTKRPERMATWIGERDSFIDRLSNTWAKHFVGPTGGTKDMNERWCRDHGVSLKERERRNDVRNRYANWWYARRSVHESEGGYCGYPPRNLYLGLSASTQADLDSGIDHLMELAAAGWNTYLSLEPLLGPVDVDGYLPGDWRCPQCDYVGDGARGGEVCERCGEPFPPPGPRGETIACQCGCNSYIPLCPRDGFELTTGDQREGGFPGTLGCVILGGETGPGARPMHPEWARAVRDQCASAGVPFFFKSWGRWKPGRSDWSWSPDKPLQAARWIENDGTLTEWGRPQASAPCKIRLDGSAVPLGMGSPHDAVFMTRVGRKAAGRLLDGRRHEDVPWHLKKRTASSRKDAKHAK